MQLLLGHKKIESTVRFNRGVLPHEMFIEQIRRFARDVLPALQVHKVTRVPLAEPVPV